MSRLIKYCAGLGAPDVWRSLAATLAIVAALTQGPACQAQATAEQVAACSTCHGASGVSAKEDVPSLAAQPSQYLVIQLYLYREGLRHAPAMNAVTKGLSDDQLQQLADYYAGLHAPAAAGGAADELHAQHGRQILTKERCGFCHGQDFAGRDNVPRLAAQRQDVLVTALRQYKSNVRPGYDATMAEVVAPLSNEDFDALADVLAHWQQ